MCVCVGICTVMFDTDVNWKIILETLETGRNTPNYWMLPYQKLSQNCRYHKSST